MRKDRICYNVILFQTTLISCFSRSYSLLNNYDYIVNRPKTSFSSSSKPSYAENSDDETPQVSDMEALLACRAYLQRKNRLNWSEGERRKQMRREKPVGFGWGEGAEYPFGDENNDANDNDGFTPIVMYDEDEYDRIEKEYNSLGDDNDRNEEDFVGVFTGLPTGPSRESALRSRHKKEQFQDPAWKEKWYRARWGNHVKLTSSMKRERNNQSKFEKVPISVWESPEFNSLTDEEIQIAIATYVSSNKKRSHKLKKEERERREKEEYEKNKKRDKGQYDFFGMSEEILRERQRRRSEKAKKAYETRVKRQEEKRKKSGLGKVCEEEDVWKPEGSTPQEAMIRINSDLDANCRPQLKDVEIMMKPTRLSFRRDTLRRILRDYFNLRGKCIPNDDGELIYVTQAQIEDIGKTVIKMLSNHK